MNGMSFTSLKCISEEVDVSLGAGNSEYPFMVKACGADFTDVDERASTETSQKENTLTMKVDETDAAFNHHWNLLPRTLVQKKEFQKEVN